MDNDKVCENRLRRMARRQGLMLQRSRARDPRALGYGHYRLTDPNTNVVEFGADPWDYSATLDAIEEWLVEAKTLT
jgi:hypothetical protein